MYAKSWFGYKLHWKTNYIYIENGTVHKLSKIYVYTWSIAQCVKNDNKLKVNQTRS
jgi:hypothetical protein